MTRTDACYEFEPGCDRTAVLQRLDQVLDPELDESVLQLGFVRSLRIRAGRAMVVLQLPTAWCAANFAFLMADGVRRALLGVEGIDEVCVELGDHFAAGAIEAAVNCGAPFSQAFPGEGGGDLDALREIFLRKGFVTRHERLVRSLAAAGLSPAEICALRVGDIAPDGDACVVSLRGRSVEAALAESARRYVERRAQLGLDCSPTAPLITDADGAPVPLARFEAQRRAARIAVVSAEANGAFCRALLATRQTAQGNPILNGGNDVLAQRI
jgi:metal-sulfur cluster biosynthetic enzyme